MPAQGFPSAGQDLFAFLNHLLEQQSVQQDPNLTTPFVTSLPTEIVTAPTDPTAALKQLMEKIVAAMGADKLADGTMSGAVSLPVAGTDINTDPSTLFPEQAKGTVDNTAIDVIAAQLNEISPGAAVQGSVADDDLATIADNVAAALGTPVVVPIGMPQFGIDAGLLSKLQDKIIEFVKSGKTDTVSFNALQNDLYRTLIAEGIGPGDAQRYLATVPKMIQEVRAAMVAPLPVPPTAGNDGDIKAAQELKEKRTSINTMRDKNAEDRATTDTAAAPAVPPRATPPKSASSALSPNMISLLNDKDAQGFGSGGFGANAEGRAQDMALPAGLKADTVDATSRGQFSNYMSQARGVHVPVTQMVALQLQRNLAARVDTMTLQLTPADLGKLDIRLKFGEDGAIRAHLRVEKPETLALLQKDAHQLERVLQDNGLNIDENSLSFDLQHKGGDRGPDGYPNDNQKAGNDFSTAMDGRLADMDAMSAMIAVQSQGYITQSGVNIMV